MNWPILLIIFSSIFMRINFAQINIAEQNQRKLELLQKLDFTVSSNFYWTELVGNLAFNGQYFVDANETKWQKEKGPQSQREMAIEHPNIDVKFYLDEEDNLRCDYVLWELPKDSKTDWQCSNKNNVCVRRWNLEDGWRMELPVLPHLYLPPAVLKSNPPANVADLKTALNWLSEHDILRTCASAYFYQGFSKSNKEAGKGRKDWILYLLEGKMECNLENKSPEENQKLMARGFTVSFSQMNTKWTEDNDQNECGLNSRMSQFNDPFFTAGGNFLIGGIIGSAQLDKIDKGEFEEMKGKKEIQKPYDDKLFWAWKQGINKKWNLNSKWQKCAENYAKWLQNDKGEYFVQIEVAHWCGEERSDAQPITSWTLMINPEEPFLKKSGGIFDWKEKLNNWNAYAKVDLGKNEMTMPDGKKYRGRGKLRKIEKGDKWWEKGGKKEKRKVEF